MFLSFFRRNFTEYKKNVVWLVAKCFLVCPCYYVFLIFCVVIQTLKDYKNVNVLFSSNVMRFKLLFLTPI